MVVGLAGNKADLEDRRKVTVEVSRVVFFLKYSLYWYDVEEQHFFLNQ